MKTQVRTLLALALLFVSVDLGAQYYGNRYGSGYYHEPLIDLDSGQVSNLKGIRKVNILYDYSSMAVGEFEREQDYIDKKMRDYSEKDPAKAERFRASWYNSRKDKFEPKFEELFNKNVSTSGIFAQNYSSDGEATLTVKVKKTEPGFHVGVAKAPAYINAMCIFTDQNGTPFLKYIIKYATGTQYMGFDYDAGTRLTESYAKCAKMLAKDITKRLKKLN